MVLKAYQRLTNNIVGLISSQDRADELRIQAALSKVDQNRFLETLKQISNMRLIAGQLAEASLRVDSEQFIVTRRKTLFSDIKPGDLLLTAISADKESDLRRFPLMIGLHRSLYQAANCQAALFCQPSATMILAAIDDALSDEVFPLAKELDIQPNYASADQARDYLRGQEGTLILDGLGLLAWGHSLTHATGLAMAIERWSEIQLSVNHIFDRGEKYE
jgi:ribulose-5-phosphate 4-epimerase/fuculose-1-phosphate aldolase